MGAAPSKTFDPIKDLPNLSGKVIIVTGSSRGIGFAVLQYLVRLGAKVYMASSNEARGKEALQRLESTAPGKGDRGGEAVWMKLDLKEPKGAQESAEWFLERESRLDVLINNAALIADMGKPALNSLGVQDNVATNYLGPMVFTRTLLPLLEKTSREGSDARIINVGSQAHQHPKSLDYSSLEAWNQKFKISMVPTFERYRYSKMAVHLWTNTLARQLEEKDSKVLVMLAEPGAILSDGAITSIKRLPLSSVWLKIAGLMMHPQETGAFTTVYAACAPRTTQTQTEGEGEAKKDDSQIKHGGYIYNPNVLIEQNKNAFDRKIQDDLERVTNEVLEKGGIVLPEIGSVRS